MEESRESRLSDRARKVGERKKGDALTWDAASGSTEGKPPGGHMASLPHTVPLRLQLQY